MAILTNEMKDMVAVSTFICTKYNCTNIVGY